MFVNLFGFVKKGERIAVATSGGADSMALLHYLHASANAFGYEVIALNVEHGIRGESSLRDSDFVKKYCQSFNIPLLSYSVDCPKQASEQKMSIEQVARKLRYECFYDAIKNGKCDKIATAHHLGDNAESILFNLFRGSGTKGVCGITANYQDKIIRPLLEVSKESILEYVEQNKIPFVTDQTNFETDYTRNYLRLKIIPEIKKIFPELESSLLRFSEIARQDDEYLESLARTHLIAKENYIEIPLPCPPALFNRCCILALKELGLSKDWEKAHIDNIISLCDKPNGKRLDMPKGIIAIKEYDKIVLFKDEESYTLSIPFAQGTHLFEEQELKVIKVDSPDLKSGFFIDFDKIPNTATIRCIQDGDTFTKFGGGTKKLCDYYTDIKLPLRLRKNTPIIADGNTVYAIFGVAISENARVDKNTKVIVRLLP